ncbi:class F sortase [Brevibacillus ginsengisoli]|uniref:class F sortase n=1 Tax=Brevibacillus ginsengisoli TaxID=363854 RepID=UPI003CEB177F
MNPFGFYSLILFITIMAGCAYPQTPQSSNNSAAANLETTTEQTARSIQASHFISNYIKHYPGNSKHQLTTKTAASPHKGISPDLLEIPSIHLRSKIEKVGLHKGQMEVPHAFDKVGLLDPWTNPGENGNAVIAGHLDHYTGPAIFYHLKRVNPGDHIYLTDSKGNKLTFTVSRVAVFKTKDAPIEEIFGDSSVPQLNLITCAGKFNKKTQEHAMRLVVFSHLTNQSPAMVRQDISK